MQRNCLGEGEAEGNTGDEREVSAVGRDSRRRGGVSR